MASGSHLRAFRRNRNGRLKERKERRKKTERTLVVWSRRCWTPPPTRGGLKWKVLSCEQPWVQAQLCWGQTPKYSAWKTRCFHQQTPGFPQLAGSDSSLKCSLKIRVQDASSHPGRAVGALENHLIRAVWGSAFCISGNQHVLSSSRAFPSVKKCCCLPPRACRARILS